MFSNAIIGATSPYRLRQHRSKPNKVKSTNVLKLNVKGPNTKEVRPHTGEVRPKTKDVGPKTRELGPKTEKVGTEREDGVKPEEQHGVLPVDIDENSPDMPKSKPTGEQAIKELCNFVRLGNHERVKKLVKNKELNVDVRDVDDELLPTPLLIAAEQNDAEMVQVLLKAKHSPAKINDEDSMGRRAIWYAAKYANKTLAEILTLNTKQKCEVNYIDKQSGCSPLYTAVLNCSPEVVQVLIHAGADVNTRRLGSDVSNETPLIKAIHLDNKAICELLLNSMCKLQAKSDAGLTALHYAVFYHRYEIVRLLLENQAKIHAKTNSGVTAMTIAIEHHNAAMVRILLQYGYKMDKRYKWKETPLEQALKLHADDCAITLLNFGCSLKKDKGKSYFQLAVGEKLLKVVKFLIALQPTYLNEDWVQESDWPVSIYYRPDIMEWIQKEAAQPRSLKQWCRAKIFKQLGRYPLLKLKELPLPETMKEYLKFQEYVKEKYCVEKPLSIKECPYDCPATCSVRYCPPIEISDSEPEPDSDDCLSSSIENLSLLRTTAV